MHARAGTHAGAVCLTPCLVAAAAANNARQAFSCRVDVISVLVGRPECAWNLYPYLLRTTTSIPKVGCYLTIQASILTSPFV